MIVAGLSGDFQGNHFGEMHLLIPKADDIHFCKAYCGLCKDVNKPAVFTKRLSKSTIRVGLYIGAHVSLRSLQTQQPIVSNE